MKIGIWGNYYYGNFGDDLMAIAIARHIKKCGHVPVVYRLNKQLANQYEIESVETIRELVKDSDFCVIGGGGVLVSYKWLKRIFSPVARKFETDFKALLNSLALHKVYIYPISIGGDGKPTAKLSVWRKFFFNSKYLKEGTVRLDGDVQLLNKFGKQFSFYPDMLFDVASHFKVKKLKPNDKVIKVGLNLIAKDLVNETWHKQLIEYAKKHSNIKLFFIKSHLPGYNIDYEFGPTDVAENIEIYQYSNPTEILSFLASLNLIISSKLHIGLTSLSLGTPFFSFKGRNKTKAMLSSIEANKAILESNFSIINFIANNILETKEKNMELFNMELLQTLKMQSKKHFEFLDSILESYAKK